MRVVVHREGRIGGGGGEKSWGTPKLHKEGNVARVRANATRFGS